jgi:hypothetical protein
MATYYGYLMSWPISDERCGDKDRKEALVASVLSAPEFTLANNAGHRNYRHWVQLNFESESPLRGEDLLPSLETKFVYPVLIRVSATTETVILGAKTTIIALSALKKIQRRLRPQMKPMRILVDVMADHLLDQLSAEFAICSLELEIAKYGSNLQSMELHGNDIARAQDIRNEIRGYVTKAIGLREAGAAKESARLGSKGTVRFYDDRLLGVEKALAFARQLNLYVV